MQEGLTSIVEILSKLRINVVDEEYELQKDIDQLLTVAGIDFKKEYVLGPRNRVDFLTMDGIAIEVKKGKPNKQRVIQQLERYTKFEEVTAVILVVETSLYIPKELNGKPCLSFGLNKLWGIAL